MINLGVLRSRSLYAGCVILLMVATDAQAYIGPGAGLTAIGSLLALVAAVVVGIFGFVWFPIRRLIKRKANDPHRQSGEAQKRIDQDTQAQEEFPKEQENTL